MWAVQAWNTLYLFAGTETILGQAKSTMRSFSSTGSRGRLNEEMISIEQVLNRSSLSAGDGILETEKFE